MTSILIATVPFHGHVTPLLTVARGFVARGDRVRFLTGSRFAESVRATGAEFLPLPAEADYDDRIDVSIRFPERASLRGSAALGFDIEHVFTRPAPAQYEAVMATHRMAPVDVMLTDPSFAGAAIVAGHPRAERPALVLCGVMPLPLSSRDTAPFGMGLTPMAGPIGRARNAVLAVLARRVFRDAQRSADELHRRVHGVGLSYSLFEWPARADAIAQFTVREFEYPRSDAPASLHFIGPIAATGPSAPLPAWWGDLDGSTPVVHVTQGTMANKDWGKLVLPTVEALAHDDVLVVVTTGGRPLDTLPALPANARAAEYLPYDELLPKTDVYVTNAGYGGVQYALRHGVPIVAIGGQEDKPEVAARITWSGVGRRIRSVSPSPRALRRAVRAVLRDGRYRRAADAMSARMAASRGFDHIAEIVDAVVTDAAPGGGPARPSRS
ncbi:glycosyltransferase [Agromyces sp. ZXT2-6]|uniref:glycosyltransferase n=1 Tax=Agromyces sp. ZXT2-6 TaxID=3461153 RepID=UPI004054B88C